VLKFKYQPSHLKVNGICNPKSAGVNGCMADKNTGGVEHKHIHYTLAQMHLAQKKDELQDG
jgi:hypothetical protein